MLKCKKEKVYFFQNQLTVSKILCTFISLKEIRSGQLPRVISPDSITVHGFLSNVNFQVVSDIFETFNLKFLRFQSQKLASTALIIGHILNYVVKSVKYIVSCKNQ